MACARILDFKRCDANWAWKNECSFALEVENGRINGEEMVEQMVVLIPQILVEKRDRARVHRYGCVL